MAPIQTRKTPTPPRTTRTDPKAAPPAITHTAKPKTPPTRSEDAMDRTSKHAASTKPVVAHTGTRGHSALSVRASQAPSGTRTVVQPDPKIDSLDVTHGGKSRYTLLRFHGPFVRAGGVAAVDVQQGYIGDCFAPAGMAALAHVVPARLREMMRDHGDGTYTFTFQRKHEDGTFLPVPITVDGDLYVSKDREPAYARSPGSTKPGRMLLWPALLEKAYAVFRGGSYDDIGNGGTSNHLFEAVLGTAGMTRAVGRDDADACFQLVSEKLGAHLPVCLASYDESGSRFHGSGVHGDHTYTVLDAFTKADGSRWLQLRNPWGNSEPAGNGKDDGVFTLPIEKALRYFCAVWTVH